MIITDTINLVGATRFTSKAGKDLAKVYYTADNDRGEGLSAGSFLTGSKDIADMSFPCTVEAAFGYDALRNWGVLGIIS